MRKPPSNCSKDRRKFGSTGSSASTSYRPTTPGSWSACSSSVAPPEEQEVCTSDLTFGGDGSSLAGTPLSAIRRRHQNSHSGSDDEGINLLRRFEGRPAECPEDTAAITRWPGEGMRPCTSDVRVRTTGVVLAGGDTCSRGGTRSVVDTRMAVRPATRDPLVPRRPRPSGGKALESNIVVGNSFPQAWALEDVPLRPATRDPLAPRRPRPSRRKALESSSAADDLAPSLYSDGGEALVVEVY